MLCCCPFAWAPLVLGFILLVWLLKPRKVACYSREAFTLFQDKVVLVTGASSGLGKELAKIFYKHGAKVILASRRLEELEKVKQELLELSPGIGPTRHEPHVVGLDLSEPDQVKDITERSILPIHGRVDILVNNAGMTSRASVADTKWEVDQSLLNVNYLGPLVLTKVILKSMLYHGDPSHILVVSSVQGRFAIPHRSSYAASKHALQAFTDSLRAELAGTSISVSLISPGYIRTNLSLNAMTSDGSSYGRMDPTTAKGYDPTYVASCCAEMVLNRTPEVILSPLVPKLLILVRALTPNLYFWIMNRYAAKAPSAN